MEPPLTTFGPDSQLVASRVRRTAERGLTLLNYAVGFGLTFGGLALAIHWHARYGGFRAVRSFYLYDAWAFGALELLAAHAMRRGWPTRWVLQLLPLAVPVIAYQYFIIHFVLRRL